MTEGGDQGKQRLAILNAFPLLSQAQGDEGNARVLAYRAGLRGIEATVASFHDPGPLPPADLYVVGGLEDEEHTELATRLRAGELADRVREGAAVLAVNAGYQVLGRRFQAAAGVHYDGLGLLDVVSTWGDLAEGPVVTRPNPALGLPVMSGYECHHGRTELGPGLRPLAPLELGVGNGDGDDDAVAAEGAVWGRVVGTYLHGPVLARNPELADLLLAWALGRRLEPAAAGRAGELREQRIAEDRADRTGWGGQVHDRPSITGGRRGRRRRRLR
jgi:CobQ-like glutamine amidotransferase family enzyme